MRLHEFLNLTYNKEELLEFLFNANVIKRSLNCPQCNNIISVCFEDLMFHCTNHYYKVIRNKKRQRKMCNFKLSALHGTWFENYRLNLVKTCRFIAYFLFFRPPRQLLLQNELQMGSHSIVDWTNFCREVSTIQRIFIFTYMCKFFLIFTNINLIVNIYMAGT